MSTKVHVENLKRPGSNMPDVVCGISELHSTVDSYTFINGDTVIQPWTRDAHPHCRPRSTLSSVRLENQYQLLRCYTKMATVGVDGSSL